jgi:hypothetical protein
MVVLGSVMVTTRVVTEVPLLVSRKLESNPFIVESVSWAGIQGEEKVDWVAVWLPWVTICMIKRRVEHRGRCEENVQLNKIVSFCFATTLSGEKTAPGSSVVLPPTLITKVSAYAEAIKPKN